MAEKALFQHHERTTTVALEGELQYREIGIDPVLKMLTAYSEVLAAKIHGVTLESPSIAFLGAISVALTLNSIGNFSVNTNKFTVAASSGNALLAGTLTNTILVGTGTRFVTSTSAGVLGNATTIDGSYSVVGTLSASNLSGTNTGDQTITLTGDVTGSGTGSFAATIAANAVSLSKMAQVATATFLGRSTASTGNVEVLSASSARAVLGLATTDSPTYAGLTLSGIAANRVLYTTTAGLITSASTLTYDGTTLAVNNGTYSGTLVVTGVSSLTGNVNINGATNSSSVGLNASQKDIATSRSAGVGGSFYSYGVSIPGGTNTEFLQVRHSGTLGELYVTKNGTGTFRDFVLYTSDVERFRVSSAGVATFSGATILGSTLTMSGGAGTYLALPSWSFNSNGDPAGAPNGSLYYDSSNAHIRAKIGGSWIEVA